MCLGINNIGNIAVSFKSLRIIILELQQNYCNRCTKIFLFLPKHIKTLKLFKLKKKCFLYLCINVHYYEIILFYTYIKTPLRTSLIFQTILTFYSFKIGDLKPLCRGLKHKLYQRCIILST